MGTRNDIAITDEISRQVSMVETVVSVEVEFGSPLKNCLHYGICRVEIFRAGGKNGCGCTAAPATLRHWEGKGLEFVFHRDHLKPLIWQKHFGEGVFLITDAYALPPAVAAAIGIRSFTISPGIYPVLVTNNNLIVIFA